MRPVLLASSRLAGKNEAMLFASVTHLQHVAEPGALLGLGAPGPNPSLKRTANSVARRPSSAGPSAHFALAVQHATLLAAA